MRWESLFADVEAQLAAVERAEIDAEVAERTRAEWSRVRLADRLRAAAGSPVQLLLTGGHHVRGVCADVALEWVVVRDGAAQVLVPLHAVASVTGLIASVAPPAPEVLRRLGLAHALRAVMRDRSTVRVLTSGAVLTGTVDRVGGDHLDLAEHPSDEPRRAASVRQVSTVPFTALQAVLDTRANSA